MVAFTTNKTVAIVALPDARNRPRPILPLTASLPPCEKKPLWTRAPTEGHGGRRDACEVRAGRRRRAAVHADVLRVPGPLARRARRARARAPRPALRGATARAPRPRHARPPAAERGDHGGLARATRSRPAQEARDRKSTRLNSSHSQISYAVFCLKKKKKMTNNKVDMETTYCTSE